MKSFRFPVLVACLAAWVLALPATAADVAAAARPGRFCWADLVTTDPDTAIAFYTKMFGWTTQEMGNSRGRYTLLLNAGKPVAGVAFRRADSSGMSSTSARWVGYIAVTDIHQAVAGVKAAGGRVLFAPHEIAGRGWQALVSDPEGSLLGLIVPLEGVMGDNEPVVNDWIWVQLLSGQPSAAVEFYRKALGYEVSDDPRTSRTDDFVLSHGGSARAGLTPLPPGTSTRPGWLGYLQVADTAAALDAAQALGARVLAKPEVKPDTWSLAVIADPLGGAIGLVSAAKQSPAKEAK
jgi:predicted enzyme related to lactoylglutathione lyase